MKRSQHKRLVIGLILGSILTFSYLRVLRGPSSSTAARRPAYPPVVKLPCSRLPGANETLVVMRTGATEFQDKMPIHLATTLRCYPNYVIMADFEERYRGEEVMDVLRDVDPAVKDAHPDFSLYRRMLKEGRANLRQEELSGPVSPVGWNTGKESNPGWKLDKWKFLPMMNRTLYEYPNMKWYLFTETDTYIMWSTLLQYLTALEHTRPYYIGAQINIGDIMFGHGGASFAVSNEALRKVTEHYVSRKKEWEDFTNGHWAGDCVLGKAFKDANAPLTLAWPIFQSDDSGVIPYGRIDNGHRLWCYPTVSYHHLSPDMIEDMWTFEQEWTARQNSAALPVLRHKDVFAEYILPRMQKPRVDWDDECEDDKGQVDTMEDCAEMCSDKDECLQYSYNPTTKSCKTSTVPRLGQARAGLRSAWFLSRVKRYSAAIPPCGDEGWIT